MGVAVQATAVAIPMPAGSLVQNVAPGGKGGGGGGGGPQVISVQAQVVGAPYVQGTVPTAAVAPVMPVATADGFFNLEGGALGKGPELSPSARCGGCVNPIFNACSNATKTNAGRIARRVAATRHIIRNI